MRTIAIDYGIKRIGIAITDPQGKIALPYKTIEGFKDLEKTVDNLLKELKDYLQTTKTIVLGYPCFLSGKKSSMTMIVEEFKKELEKKIDIKIVFFDERLTSNQANLVLKEQGLSRKKRKKTVDQIAALIILQTYLEMNN